jgi:hypothetical protein
VTSINSYDNVGIGTNAPTHKLHIVSNTAAVAVISAQNGTGTCTYTPASSGTGTWSCSSDARLKKDIEDTTNGGTDYLSTFRIRDFTMKSDGSRQTGVIAQEVLQTHPEMVHKDDKGFYMVDEPHKWLIVKALQELKAANDNLRDDIDELRMEVKALKAGQPASR